MKTSVKLIIVNAIIMLTGLTFIVLKLANVICWSWWWVTSPFWIMALVIAAFIALIFWTIKDIKE